MRNPDLKEGDRLFFDGDYFGAFARYSVVSNDPTQSAADRSSAFAAMASVIGAWPAVYPDDETGLTFLRRAIEQDPHNPYAWWCVIESFGEHYPSHQDLDLARRAVEWLDAQPLAIEDRRRLENLRHRHPKLL